GIDSAGDTQPGLAAMDALQLRDEAEARAAQLEAEVLELRAAMDADGDPDLARLRGELAAARDRILALEREAGGRAGWSSSEGLDAAKLARELERLRAAAEEAEAARSVAEHAAGEAMR